MNASDWIVVALLACGTGLSLLGAVGLLRMPDLYMRMQAATKAGTLGLACIVGAAAVHFADAFIAVQCGLIVVFLFLTSPVASHLVARAGYVGGVRPWGQTGRDDLRDALDLEECRRTGAFVARGDRVRAAERAAANA